MRLLLPRQSDADAAARPLQGQGAAGLQAQPDRGAHRRAAGAPRRPSRRSSRASSGRCTTASSPTSAPWIARRCSPMRARSVSIAPSSSPTSTARAVAGRARPRPGRGRQGRRRRHPDVLHQRHPAGRRPAARGVRRRHRQGPGRVALKRGRERVKSRPCNEPGRSLLLSAPDRGARRRRPAAAGNLLRPHGAAAADADRRLGLGRARRAHRGAPARAAGVDDGRSRRPLARHAGAGNGGRTGRARRRRRDRRRRVSPTCSSARCGSGRASRTCSGKCARRRTPRRRSRPATTRASACSRSSASPRSSPKDDVTPMDAAPTWMVATPASITNFSAVGYFFSRDLQRAQATFRSGSSTARGAARRPRRGRARDVLAEDPALQPLLSQYRRFEAEYPSGRYGYDRRQPADRAGAQGMATRRIRTEPPMPGVNVPRGAPDDPHRPASLWNAMIAPLTPFAIRGVLWYQGETNALRAWDYQRLMTAMIQDWRRAWNRGDLPFLFVQLANFRPNPPTPGAHVVGGGARGAAADARPAEHRRWPRRSTSATRSTSIRSTSRKSGAAWRWPRGPWPTASASSTPGRSTTG